MYRHSPGVIFLFVYNFCENAQCRGTILLQEIKMLGVRRITCKIYVKLIFFPAYVSA